LKLAREALRAGKTGFLSVLEAQKRLLAAKRDANMWAEASALMLIELEAACGRPLRELLEEASPR
jgi:outer membrane protein TolC